MTRPTMLVAFSGQGGSAAGWYQAGFDVFCVDTDPKALVRNPFPSARAEAVEYIGNEGHRFDVIEAGPVCKAYSKTARIWDAGHPEQIPDTRKALANTGRPYVIENVEEALPELIEPVMLCGQSFGLRTYRHRLFESNMPLSSPRSAVMQLNPESCGFVHRYPLAKMGRPVSAGRFYHAVGNFSGVELVRSDLGVAWMNRDGINQCIPPAYTRYLGSQILEYLRWLP